MTTSKVRELSVTTPQGEAGTLTKESRHVFAYSTREQQRQVSLTMPLRAETYSETPMLAAFSMNRPEGFLLDRIERAFKHVELDDMALLSITGGNQIGRLRFNQPGRATHGKNAEVGPNHCPAICAERRSAAVILAPSSSFPVKPRSWDK